MGNRLRSLCTSAFGSKAQKIIGIKVPCHCKVPVWLVASCRYFKDRMDMEGKLMRMEKNQQRAKRGVYDSVITATNHVYT